MDLILCWIIAPAGLLVIATGLSLLIERITGLELPWTVRPALGIGVAIVITQFATATDTTAELAVPAMLILAAVGLVMGWGSPSERPTRAEIGTFVGVFLLFGSPFLILGTASWAGYIKLDDTATWLALTDHVFEFGRGIGHLPLSTHEATIDNYLAGSYPIGAFVPMKLMSTITGQDIAFTFQPSMAFAAATMALLIFELVRRVIKGVPVAVAVAVLGSLSAITLGYYLWGGVKELEAAALLPLGAVLIGVGIREGWPRVICVPIAVAAAALLCVIGPGALVWLGPILLPGLVVLAIDEKWAGLQRVALPAALLLLLLIIPVLLTPTGIFNPVQPVLTEATELGNLSGPLNLLHVAGLWPSIDFRSDPHMKPVTLGLAVLALLIAAITVVVCARLEDREGVPFAAYAGGAAVGGVVVIAIGSPWVDGKSMATISPALLSATLLGIVLLAQRTQFRYEAAGLGAVIGVFVLWGAFLAYQGVWFAPRAQMEELDQIGQEFDGKGPALSTEVTIFGGRHFLRGLDAEGASDLRRRQVLLVDGTTPGNEVPVDLDQIQQAQLEPYNLLVIRRGPGNSRAPGTFRLADETDHYLVWQRQETGSPLGHLALGTAVDAGGVPSCADVAKLAAKAGDGNLVAARVPITYTVDLSDSALPAGWSRPSNYTFAPTSSGSFSAQTLTPPGQYELWMGGVIFGKLQISIDGSEVASERSALDAGGGLDPLGKVTLEGSDHTVSFEYHAASLAPGSAPFSYVVGPLTLAPTATGDLGTQTIPASDYKQLCGTRWDWIEAYGG